MPIYEYKCEGCGDTFEIIQKFSDEPLTVHDKCGGKVERVLSAPALQFKGAGWYVNDYGKGKSQESKSKSEGSNGAGKSEKSNGPASESAGKSESSSKTDSSSSTSSAPSASKSDNKK